MKRGVPLILAIIGLFGCFGPGLAVLLALGADGQKVRIKEIDGIPHIVNPQKPLKGRIRLEVEKVLEINPYDHEEIGLKYFYFIRDRKGNVILYNPNVVEAQKFNHKGEWLDPLVRKGQGPGEFPDFSFFRVFFVEDKILAAGNMKLAVFDKNGLFIGEKKIGERSVRLVDENSYIFEGSKPDEAGLFKQIVFVQLPSTGENTAHKTVLFEAAGVGWIAIPGGGFADEWVTPDIKYSIGRQQKVIFLAHNKEYKIYVKSLKGDNLRIIERPFRPARLNSEGRKKLFSKFKGGNIQAIENAYPDQLVVIKDLQPLPQGWLAVFRITDAEQFEIDVFDSEGNYTYIFERPAGMSLSEGLFHESGFSLKEEKGDFLVYSDYRIKNLPHLFR